MHAVLNRILKPTLLSLAVVSSAFLPATPSAQSLNASALLASGQASRPGGSALPANFNVSEFESLARQIVSEGKIPGMAMAIVHNGKIISERGYGMTKPWGGVGVTAQTVYRLASLSKSFASTTTAMVVDEGKLNWNTKVSSVLPEFRLIDADATAALDVADLLSHRTGLPKNAYDREIERGVDYPTLRGRLATVKLTCRPGTCYNYQNVAYSVVGDVIQRATGVDYRTSVMNRVLKPLGMTNSSLGLWSLKGSGNWAQPTVHRGGAWTVVEPKPTYYEVLPAAGVNSSVHDMALYMMAHLGHRPDVLPASMLRMLHTELVNTPREATQNAWRRERLSSAGYALGWRVFKYAGRDVIFHGGAVQGYRTAMAMMPGKDIGVVLLWNSESGTPSGLLPMVLDRAIGISSKSWVRINGINLGEYEAGEAPASSAPASQKDPLGELINSL